MLTSHTTKYNVLFKTTTINYATIGQFSKTIIDYLDAAANIKPYYKYEVNINTFKQIIEDKNYDNSTREILSATLHQQYEDLSITTPEVLSNLNLLKNENTYTVCTAHQLNLFTGPLYVVFKIVSCINLSKQLKAAYPAYNFVPVFWLGSEDHDLAEINHFNLFNKKVKWTTPQTGATGRMTLENISEVLEQTFQILGDSTNASYLKKILNDCFTKNDTLQNATTQFLNTLFGQYGLVIINGDHHSLKKIFITELQTELSENIIEKKVTASNEQFGQHYKIQAAPRAINLFYLKDALRERIVWNETANQFEVLNTNLYFTKTEMEEELQQHPERFSPNVLMRPLYQEKILPNLAYIGGGGELAYWLQLKSTFESFNINYPLLVLRNSAAFIDKKTVNKWASLGFGLSDFFNSENELSNIYINKNEQNEVDFTKHLNKIQLLKSEILKDAQLIDEALNQPIDSEFSKIEKSINNLEQKFTRATKRQHSDGLNQITSAINKVFPKGGLQERQDNFMQYYLKYGAAFFGLLFEHFDCLAQQFLVFEEE